MAEGSTDLVPRTPAPGSALWRHFGDARAGLFGPHALLLQVMHPVVDAGVKQHSRFKTEPFARLFETVRSMTTLVYGGADGAAAESRRLRALHRAIRGVDSEGSRYHSLDPEAWAWVYATLVKGAMDAQQRFGRKVPAETVERYYREARELGMVLGVRAKDLPEDWAGFEAYFDRMVETRLRDTESAHDVLRFLRELPKPFFVPRFLWNFVTWPIVVLIDVVTVQTLPETVRAKLGLAWAEWKEELLLWSMAAAKIVSAIVPRFFFYFGARVIGYLNGRIVLRRERKAFAALAAQARDEGAKELGVPSPDSAARSRPEGDADAVNPQRVSP